jgi:hypothetical protein
MAAAGCGRRPDFLERLEVTVAGPLRTRTGFLRRTASMMSHPARDLPTLAEMAIVVA